MKFSIFFRGREVAHTDVGLSVMERMAESLVEFGTVDAKPKIMGRSMIMMMKPKPKLGGALCLDLRMDLAKGITPIFNLAA